MYICIVLNDNGYDDIRQTSNRCYFYYKHFNLNNIFYYKHLNLIMKRLLIPDEILFSKKSYGLPAAPLVSTLSQYINLGGCGHNYIY